MKQIVLFLSTLLFTLSSAFAQDPTYTPLDLLVVFKNDGKIAAYNLGNLESRWNYQFVDSSYNKMRNQFRIERNTLYAVSTQNQLVSINLYNGVSNWTQATFEQEKRVKRYETSGQRLPILNNMIFASNNVNGLNAFDRYTGRLVWNAIMHYPFNNYPPVLYNDKLYIQSAPLVYCFDVHTGTLLWYRNYERVPMYTLITTDGEVVIVGDERNNLYALDASTGEDKWQYTTSYEYPRIDELIVLSADRHQLTFVSKEKDGFSITALDTKNGKENWKQLFTNTEAEVKSLTSIGDYYIMTTKDEEKHFYVVDRRDGKQMQTPFPKEQPLSNVIPYGKHQLAFLTKSYLTLFDLQTKSFEYRPIQLEYEINDSFNLHFDIAYDVKNSPTAVLR